MAEFVQKLSRESVGGEEYELLRLLIRFRGFDLEAILGELDTIISLDYANEVSGRYVGSTPTSSVEFNIHRGRAISLRYRIKHEIIKQYRYVDGSKVVELYAPIFESLFSQFDSSQNVLNVFTTNYDPAIELFCKRQYGKYSLCDGFRYLEAERDHVWDRDVFDGYQLVPGKRNIVLFKLHGSIDWMEIKESGRICRSQPMFDAMDSDVFSNALIYPATRKIAISEPFYSAYEYYQRCCESSRACMAIGYSFRDYDALMRLRGARSVNEKFRLVLLAPDADVILKAVPLEEDRKVALCSKFCTDSHAAYIAAFRDVAGFDHESISRLLDQLKPVKPDATLAVKLVPQVPVE